MRSPAVDGPARSSAAAGRYCAGRHPALGRAGRAAAARRRGPRGSSSGVPPRRPAARDRQGVGDRQLLVAAGGEMGPQSRAALGGAAVADGFAEDLQALAAGVLGAQGGQPRATAGEVPTSAASSAGSRRPPPPAPAQVGVGDRSRSRPAAPPAPGRGRVRRVGPGGHGQAGCHADLAGEGGCVDRLAGVDLAASQCRRSAPGRPRISGPLLLRVRDAGGVVVGGHRRPPSRSGQTTRAAAADPARGPGGAGCA